MDEKKTDSLDIILEVSIALVTQLGLALMNQFKINNYNTCVHDLGRLYANFLKKITIT